MEILTQFQHQLTKTVSALKEELKSYRSGRVTPSLIENLMVETYGGKTKLKLFQLATIHIEGPTVLSITPFDPQTLSDIEKAILKSPLGISPCLSTNRLLLNFPPLSAEQREKILKLVNQKIEEKKQIIRDFRNKARKSIKTAFEEKAITEDKKVSLEKEIDQITQKFIEEIQKIKENKEKEILL